MIFFLNFIFSCTSTHQDATFLFLSKFHIFSRSEKSWGDKITIRQRQKWQQQRQRTPQTILIASQDSFRILGLVTSVPLFVTLIKDTVISPRILRILMGYYDRPCSSSSFVVRRRCNAFSGPPHDFSERLKIWNFGKNKKVSSRRGDVQQKKNPKKVIFSARRPFFASLIRLYPAVLKIEW